jgi:hypothetical protein
MEDLKNIVIYTIVEYWWLILLAWFAGSLLKQWQRTSKDVNDLYKYSNIQDVIKEFGTPDNISKYGAYTKYTFKRSTNGWGHNKYIVDIFTLEKGKLIKHEHFQE